MNTQLLTNVILVLVAVAAGYDRYKSGASTAATNTISLLKEQNAAKDVKIAEMKAAHDTAMAAMQADINALKAQLEHMKEQNIVLTNTVTGKETLLEITKILKPIPGLFATGGFIEQVKINQDKVLKDLSEIRRALEASPAVMGPENRDFKKRETLAPAV